MTLSPNLMFLCSTSDNKNYAEGSEFIDSSGNKKKLTWDDIPKDAKLTVLQLLYPFPVFIRGAEKPITPKLTLKGFDQYFFYNEQMVSMLVQGQSVVQEGKPALEAKVIAGIDKKSKLVLEFRMDKWGNCTVRKYPLKTLQRQIKKGLFRSEIIRDGA